MTPRFEKAYNALYNAFMNDTLAKGTCRACAVGNIVADAMGTTIEKYKNEHREFVTYECKLDNTFWSKLFFTVDGEQERGYCEEKTRKLEELTGYSIDEMAKIEYAFETNTEIVFSDYYSATEKEIMEDQFRGLMAVMDVMIQLDEIHEGEKYKETFKNKFAYEH